MVRPARIESIPSSLDLVAHVSFPDFIALFQKAETFTNDFGSSRPRLKSTRTEMIQLPRKEERTAWETVRSIGGKEML